MYVVVHKVHTVLCVFIQDFENFIYSKAYVSIIVTLTFIMSFNSIVYMYMFLSLQILFYMKQFRASRGFIYSMAGCIKEKIETINNASNK